MNVASSQTHVVIIIPCFYSRTFLYKTDLVVPLSRYHLPSFAASFFLSERCTSLPQDGDFFLLLVVCLCLNAWQIYGLQCLFSPTSYLALQRKPRKELSLFGQIPGTSRGHTQETVYSLWEYLRSVDEQLLSNVKSVCTNLFPITDSSANLTFAQRWEIVWWIEYIASLKDSFREPINGVWHRSVLLFCFLLFFKVTQMLLLIKQRLQYRLWKSAPF